MIRSTMKILLLITLCLQLHAQDIYYSVEYGSKPPSAPGLTPVFHSSYLGFSDIWVVVDNWYYASRARADQVNAVAFLIPGGSTSDVPFYDGSLDDYVDLLRNPARPTIGFCAGIQFLMMARGGICAHRSGESGDHTATIFSWDEIFNGCPNPYTDRAAHSYSIAAPPAEYQIMASTRTCYVTFARHVTMPLYGTQLHIERFSNANTAGYAILSNFKNVIVPRAFHGIAEALDFPGQPGRVRLVWWPARTNGMVSYQIYHSSSSEPVDFQTPIGVTTGLSYDLAGLLPDITHHFAVRAVNSEFTDTNQVIFSIQPDGHETYILQNGRSINGGIYADCEATVMRAAYPDANYGQQGAPGKGELYWWNSGLVRFNNLELHLANKTVLGGELTFLFAGGVTSTTTINHVAQINIYRIRRNWLEGRGWNNSSALSGEVTWNSARHGIETWEISGCRGTSDRDPVPIASYTIRGDGSGIAFDGTLSLSADLLQFWIDHPDSNFGLLFEKQDTYPHDEYFWFEDNQNDWFMNRPRLIVYTAPETHNLDSPEPMYRPLTLTVLPNYPNPFNPATTLPYQIHAPGDVRLQIFNLIGQKLEEHVFINQSPGQYVYRWDAMNYPSGIYFLRLSQAEQLQTRKVILAR